MKLLLCSCLLVLSSLTVFGQSKSPDSKSPETKSLPQQNSKSTPNALRPSPDNSYHQPTKSSRSSRSRRHAVSPEEEFYARMKAVAKSGRKQEQEMQKPQYSDPAYFGHKRMPKRHRAGKLRYCKECGIRH